MEQELVKKLKDAGFPFKMGEEIGVVERDAVKIFGGIDIPEGSFIIDPPTLSELIEACGDSLGKLVRESNTEWYVYDLSRVHCIRGSTPEEAVANLYIALNKK